MQMRDGISVCREISAETIYFKSFRKMRPAHNIM